MSIAVFAANDGVNGNELWRTDGTIAGTVLLADIDRGPGSSAPTGFMKFGGFTYFSATAGGVRQLWRTDGTVAGTAAVATVDASPLAVAGDKLYLRGGTGRFYVSDGTAAGTKLVTSGGSAQGFTVVGDKLFYTATDAANGNELWVADGSGVARLVKDIVPGPNGSQPDNFAVLGGKLYFTTGDQAWVSDGTAAGTKIVDAPPAAVFARSDNLQAVNGKLVFWSNSVLGSPGYSLWSLDPGGSATKIASVGDLGNLANFGDRLYFSTNLGALDGGAYGKSGVYVTDGTSVRFMAEGDTGRVVADLHDRVIFVSARYDAGSTGDTLYAYDWATGQSTVLMRGSGASSASVVIDGRAYFAATGGLWVSDGTTGGTHLLASVSAANLAAYDGDLLFSANGQLWTSDGTAGGTHPILTVKPPASTGYMRPSLMAAFGDRVVFSAIEGGEGRPETSAGVWVSDGTAAGTFMLSTAGGDAPVGASLIAAAGGRVFMSAPAGTAFSQRQLWATGGASGDLVQLTGPGTSVPLNGNLGRQGPVYFTAVGDRFYFADQATSQLYVVDPASNAVAAVGGTTISGPGASLGGAGLFMGSTGGTSGLISVTGATPSFIGAIPVSAPYFTVSGSRMFIAGSSQSGLWATNGTAAGTGQISDVTVSGSFTAFKGGVAFVADDRVHGYEVWYSNGTAAGTFLVADLDPRLSGDLNTPRPLVLSAANDKLYFTASNGTGTGLYSFDGAAGSVRQLPMPTGAGAIVSVRDVGGALYLTAQTGTNSRQVWRMDPGGQSTVISDAGPTELVRWVTVAGDKLFFYVTVQPVGPDDQFGPAGRLYAVGGPTAPAELIGTFKSLNSVRVTSADGHLYFQAGNDADNVELWASDGTAAGTVRVTDTRVFGTGGVGAIAIVDADLPAGEATYNRLYDSYNYLLRARPEGTGLTAVGDLAAKIAAGQMTHAAAVADLVDRADATTSVATLAYQFFTGSIPSAAGLDYLVSPAGANAANLNSAYYQSFSLENRYINFAVNLGKYGAGAAGFSLTYGGMSLFDATRAAYTKIFGSTPTDTKLHALVDPRADYFAYYGQDGANGIGTKAAMVGWLLSEAVKADIGTYATANEAFLTDLADGSVNYAVDIVGVYGGTAYTG